MPLTSLALNLEGQENPVIPLSAIESSVLAKVLEYCRLHEADPPQNEKDLTTVQRQKDIHERRLNEIDARDTEFVPKDQVMLFKLINAANYLEATSLLDLLCKNVANMIRGKTVEEIRRTFNIQSDFTPEEEELIRKENLAIEDFDLDRST